MTAINSFLEPPIKLARHFNFSSNEILYFEGDINYTHIYLATGKPKTLSRTLLTIEHRIGTETFVRISRKHLVNRKFIVEIGADYVVMSNKKTLPISRRKRGVL